MACPPGNYRFADYLRMGMPMNLPVGAVAIAIPVGRWQLAA